MSLALRGLGFVALGLVLGCGGVTAPVSPPTGAPPDAMHPVAATGPTYWRDVAPILQSRCVQCHSAGGIGPFELTSYAEARPRAELMVQETGARRMPPWMPDDHDCRTLQDSQAMPVGDIDTLARWAAAGAPEGDHADYVAPSPVSDPLPATADLVVQANAPYTPTTQSTDDYRCFVLDPALATNRDVIGMRVTAGNPQIVHHVILYEVRAESVAELQRLDDATPGEGYTCFGGSGIQPTLRRADLTSGDLLAFNQQFVGAWAPGFPGSYFPDGTAIRLAPGDRLVMQVHYNLTAQTRGMSDRSRVELFTSTGTHRPNQAYWLPLVDMSFLVPAGTPPDDPRATVHASIALPLPLQIYGVAPHMHLHGRSIRTDLDHPDGSHDCLVNIPRWNFHWQRMYWFDAPVRPVVGATPDRLRITCNYDNSPANQPVIDGVQMTPRDLSWGERTIDEMCLNFLYLSL